MPSNQSSESAAVSTAPKNLLWSMLCAWNQVNGEAARWLSGTHRAVAPYIGSEQPTVDGLPDTPSSTPRYTRKFHDDSIPRSTSQSTHQVININVKDPDRPARSATFPFLVIEDIVALQALRKPEGVKATTSYCDVEKLLLDSAGQVQPLRRRRISQNVQYRHAFLIHACDLVVRPLHIIGNVDYNEKTDELVYTVASNAIGWDVILNFLTALAGAARTVGHADTQTPSRPGSQPHQGHRLHSM